MSITEEGKKNSLIYIDYITYDQLLQDSSTHDVVYQVIMTFYRHDENAKEKHLLGPKNITFLLR